MAQFIFKVFRVRLPRLPDQINPVCHLRHEPFGKTKRPIAVFVISRCANRIAARIGCVVISAVVVDRPIGELKMRVRADGILIEEIHHAELPEADFQPASRQFLK